MKILKFNIPNKTIVKHNKLKVILNLPFIQQKNTFKNLFI